MEIRDWIMSISATIIVAGWFVNGWLNRKHEISKKRMECRLDALNSFLPVFYSIQKHESPFIDDPDFLSKLEFSRSKFQIYGVSDEIEIFELMIKAIESKNAAEFASKAQELVLLVRQRIRIQIGLNT